MIVRPLLSGEALPKGLSIGHACEPSGRSGLSVLLFDPPALGAASLFGRATSTRQADSLHAKHHVTRLDAFLMTGGSAFGLGASDGLLRFLAERGRGLPTPYGVVPIAPTAALFDLGYAQGAPRPDAALAYEACRNATTAMSAKGSIGAGAGATVGKLFGLARAGKGGFGTAIATDGPAQVWAFAFVNAFGDILHPESGAILAGARQSPDSKEFVGTAKALAEGLAPKGFGATPSPENTVLVALVTPNPLDKLGLSRLAHRAGKAFAQVVSPITPFDGDLVFAASLLGEQAAPLDVLLRLAAAATPWAIAEAVA